MRALYLASDITQLGGIQKYNSDFIDSLKRAGVQTGLVELYGTSLVAKFSFVLRVLLMVVRLRPHLLCVGHIAFASIARILHNILGIPYTVNLYGVEALNLRQKFDVSSLRYAARVVVISHYFKEVVCRQIPEIEDRLTLIPSAVDEERMTVRERPAYLAQRYGLGENPVILTVCRLTPMESKGYDRVLAALPLIARNHPDVRYIIAGKGSDPRIDEALRDPEVKRRAILTGPVSAEELPALYNLADVFVMPSKFEGFGIVFIEALACGTPVIASNGFGCPEALLNGELGRTTDPDDIDGLARAVSSVLSQGRLALEQRTSLRNRSLSLYSIARFRNSIALMASELLCDASRK